MLTNSMRNSKIKRNDFLHKLSRYYVDDYDVICVEDLDVLDVKDTVKNGKSSTLNGHVHDSSWPSFLSPLAYERLKELVGGGEG